MRNVMAKYAPITRELISARAADLKVRQFSVLMASTDGGYVAGAAALGLKVGTFKSRLNRAREALRMSCKHPNGAPMYAKDWTPLNEEGKPLVLAEADQKGESR